MLGLDIILGRDSSIGVEDYLGNKQFNPIACQDIHALFEQQFD